METLSKTTIYGGFAASVTLKAGQSVRITEADKCQVGDLICYSLEDIHEHVSPSHTRCSLKNIYLKKGDMLYSNRRRGLLKLVDMSDITNDLLYPACDISRYTVDFGFSEYHRNCVDNFACELQKYGIIPECIAEPVNLFENAPVKQDGSIDIKAPISKKGDYITFLALKDVIVAVSACPMDAEGNKTNAGYISNLLLEVLEPKKYCGLNNF